MKFRQIEAFRAIIRHGTMTAAAGELRTSQPSISRLIAELESVTQLRLFNRQAGRVTPTDEGLAFYREVEQSFAGLENLAQAAQDIRFFGAGRLRIAAIPAMALGFVPEVIGIFRQRFPNVTVSLQMHDEVAVTYRVASRSCDVGFTANFIEAVGIEVDPLYRLPGVCALPVAHRLASQKVIHPKDIEKETFISLAFGDGARARIDQIFEAHAVNRIMSLETPYGAIMCTMVGQGLGIGIVNPIVASSYRSSDVVFKPFEPDIHFQGNSIVRQDRQKGGLVDVCVAIARAHVRKYESRSDRNPADSARRPARVAHLTNKMA